MNSKISKTVLLITPFFAPQSHAAVFRVHKLAKYLPRFGWKPYVLTVDTNYNYNEDRGLLDDLPSEVEIIRARYVEPSLRGLRMALGGGNRTFSQQKRENAVPTAQSSDFLINFYKALLARYLYSPDQFWTWYHPAVCAAKDLIDKYKIPIIYTTALPYTSLRIGAHLKETKKVHWVCDFRDPGTYSLHTTSKVPAVFALQRKIERESILKADVVTGLSSAYPLIFNDMYGINEMHFIPTGVDQDLVNQKVAVDLPKFPYLLFVGEVLEQYGDRFFRLFQALKQENSAALEKLKVIVIGNVNINRAVLKRILPETDNINDFELIDHLPQEVLYKFINAALATVLIPGPSAFWWTNFAKLVDYIGLRAPVIAIVPDPSEARTQLKKAGLGFFLDGKFEDQLKEFKNFLFEKMYTNVKPSDEICNQYLAHNMTESFVKIFEQLSKSL